MAPSRASLTAAARISTRASLLPSRSLPGLRSSRTYHSYDHPQQGAYTSTESAILSAAYKHVPDHGFTPQALSLGARDAGYLDISTNLLPDGVFSLVRYHLVRQREALAPRSRALWDNAHVSEDKVERLTWERLLSNQNINHRWQEALAIMAQPSHVPTSIHELALLVDEIFHLAGDKAVDPSWYTKRGALSVIYASSELFMTNDRSANFADTRSFLRRRLDETSSMSGTFGAMRQWAGFTASAGVNVLRSKGLRI